jgi:hypothetical protein
MSLSRWDWKQDENSIHQWHLSKLLNNRIDMERAISHLLITIDVNLFLCGLHHVQIDLTDSIKRDRSSWERTDPIQSSLEARNQLFLSFFLIRVLRILSSEILMYHVVEHNSSIIAPNGHSSRSTGTWERTTPRSLIRSERKEEESVHLLARPSQSDSSMLIELREEMSLNRRMSTSDPSICRRDMKENWNEWTIIRPLDQWEYGQAQNKRLNSSNESRTCQVIDN